jgi:hypothetical protein
LPACRCGTVRIAALGIGLPGPGSLLPWSLVPRIEWPAG